MEYKFKPGDVVEVVNNGRCFDTYKTWAYAYGLNRYSNVLPVNGSYYMIKCSGPHGHMWNTPIYGIEALDGTEQFIIGEAGLILIKQGTTMNTATNATTKAEAIAQVQRLEEELNKLKAIINKPDELVLTTVDGKEILTSGKEMARIGTSDGLFEGYRSIIYHPKDKSNGNILSSEPVAKEWAKAINTMFLLRRQPGVKAATKDTVQYLLYQGCGSVRVTQYQSLDSKLYFVSPCFENDKLAHLAITTVGEETILHMFKTLQGL